MSNPAKRRGMLANALDSIVPPNLDLAEPAPAAKSASSPAPTNFMQKRADALSEMSRFVKKAILRLKPSECSIWPGNARTYSALTYDNCQTLIDSIKEEGMNREAVIVRRTSGAERPYELIVGTRRHFAISWLHENHHSEIDLIASVEDIDDEAAFRIADIENRERKDINDYERAMNYQYGLSTFYDNHKSRMAERLAVSASWLKNFLYIAELPEPVIDAYRCVDDIKYSHAMKLMPLINRGGEALERVLAEASVILAEQRQQASEGLPGIEGHKVNERLVAAATRVPTVGLTTAPTLKKTLTTPSGQFVATVLTDTKKKGLTINIKPDADVDDDTIIATIKSAIANARFHNT